ncbi:protein REPRESSOR OF SILENCING 3 [Rutidosis leptorrhynchoides]|uniref:protein REPRESSOR OF SILENCING 3 n=1 Tax=Rutidosis leptorrhynchoides TaxID=125765 RepID=UPI003A991526
MEEATPLDNKTRIYVGGLGGAVTEDDLRKTFSSLGDVISVDIVRTKDRSFAYLDFVPLSDKSLPKLFSTYNGCMWKGGKLRLEKAKEHYLLRLKREWQEEAENVKKAFDSCNADDASKSRDTIEKPKKPSPADKTQINIFFPKLGKVKSLAQVGIGKHKYSFQHIQVPALPTHFCDCEEHSLAFPPPSKRQIPEVDTASYEINEKELDIMNSVMNKIFERANPSKQVIGKSESVNIRSGSSSKNELVDVENDEEDNLTDEDNLIINVANGNNDCTDMLGEMRTMMANREPVAKKPITKKPKIVNESSQKKTTPLSKKTKLPQSKKIDNKAEIESDKKQPESNSLRSLKSTWKDMLGQKRKTSFNISEFIASIPQKTQVEVKGDDADQSSIDKKNLVDNNQSKSEDDKKEPELLTNIDELTTEVVDDIIANDLQQKEKEPVVDNLDVPLTTTAVATVKKFSVSDVVQDIPNREDEEPRPVDLDCKLEKVDNYDYSKKLNETAPVKNDQDLIRTARGEFWRHKSSWTQLISTASNSSFSISQIVPSLSYETKHEQKVGTLDSQPENKNLDNQIPTGKEVALSPVKKKTDRKRKIMSLDNLESEGSCSFMRTEESMKEWRKAKASLKGTVNKKKRLANESA